MEVVWIGGAYKYNVDDVEGLVGDMSWTGAVSVVLVLLLLLGALRDARVLPILFTAAAGGHGRYLWFCGLGDWLSKQLHRDFWCGSGGVGHRLCHSPLLSLPRGTWQLGLLRRRHHSCMGPDRAALCCGGHHFGGRLLGAAPGAVQGFFSAGRAAGFWSECLLGERADAHAGAHRLA